MYCSDLFNYRRRKSSLVCVGELTLGAESPIRIQSMTNTSTMDTEACVKQAERIVATGGEIVRLTAQGLREAENLSAIRTALRAEGVNVPLVADIHFNPKAAEAAAERVEKVRINPGNFAKNDIKERLLPFLAICKQHHTAIRIGVNHGSLSARMLERYGDTPEGMVASCMEYLRICVEENFRDIVISIKASNPLIMVQTVRLLVSQMDAEGMSFPLHLGVTEAGDGEDGRIKSAVGIGALLADGIGDTIRVSLSEAPEAEIPVAKKLVQYIEQRQGHTPIVAEAYPRMDACSFHRRETRTCGMVGGNQPPVVVLDASAPESAGYLTTMDSAATLPDLKPDLVYTGSRVDEKWLEKTYCMCDSEVYRPLPHLFPVYTVQQFTSLKSQWQTQPEVSCFFLRLTYSELTDDLLAQLNKMDRVVILLESHHINAPAEMRAAFHRLMIKNCTLPVILSRRYEVPIKEDMQLYAAADYGFLLLDGLGDGLFLQAPCQKDSISIQTMFGILQASHLRISKTEYISCPSCGRTLFDLQTTIAKVKAATAHLKGLKIAIMGCIVNGPGEMADADYGYVGAGRGRVSLYRAGVCVEKNIPEEEALTKLLALIDQDR